MDTLRNMFIGGLAAAVMGVGTGAFEEMGSEWQGGQPSAAPGPSTPAARPANSQPRPSTPNNTTPQPPNNTSPANQPGQPVQPGSGNTNDGSGVGGNGNNGTSGPGTPTGNPPVTGNGVNGNGVNGVNGNGVNGNDAARQSVSAGSRLARPFAFQSPEMEARFTENARRLMAMEDRLDRSNQDLTRRLGEIRGLPAERQNTATLDLLQQVLLQNRAMNQYLVQARTGWSGEFDTGNGTVDPNAQNNPNTGQATGTASGGTGDANGNGNVQNNPGMSPTTTTPATNPPR